MKTISITIERDKRYIEVEVVLDSTCLGYEEDGTKHTLTQLEQDEARAISELRDEPDDFPAVFATGREADNAANAYFGELGMRADRRAS